MEVIIIFNRKYWHRPISFKMKGRCYFKILKTLAFVLLSWVLTTNLVLADSKSNDSKLDPTLRVLSQNSISVNKARDTEYI